MHDSRSHQFVLTWRVADNSASAHGKSKRLATKLRPDGCHPLIALVTFFAPLQTFGALQAHPFTGARVTASCLQSTPLQLALASCRECQSNKKITRRRRVARCLMICLLALSQMRLAIGAFIRSAQQSECKHEHLRHMDFLMGNEYIGFQY